MRRPVQIMILLALALSCMPLPTNDAFAHGDPPSRCKNRYDAAITSMSIDNGTQTFDPMSDSNLTLYAQVEKGYNVTLTLHTANASSQNNTLAGSTWYTYTALGFGNGVCVNDAGPEEDITLAVQVGVMDGVPDGHTQPDVRWGSWPGADYITYDVVWHYAGSPEQPMEEPEEEQLPQHEEPADSSKQPSAADNDSSDENDKESENDDDRLADNLSGKLLSPFIFKNETTAVSASEVEDGGEVEEQQLPQEIVDVLEINGTLASYHYIAENGTAMQAGRLHVLSGDWVMEVNDTAVFDFRANFTMVRADGLGREAFSLGNFTAVDASDLRFGFGTMAVATTVDLQRANGTAVEGVNATITIERLNVIKIELHDDRAARLGGPVYGVVDKLERSGETLAVARQFNMI